jgi:hypothetical protein
VDRRLPGRNYQQAVSLEGDEDAWAVDRIIRHRGKGKHAMFDIERLSGDRTWGPFGVIKHLEALQQYLEAQGEARVKDLPWMDDEGSGESGGTEMVRVA